VFAFIAGGTVFHASARSKTFEDFLVAGSICQVIGILEGESMCGMMLILVAHKAINAQGEILASIAHNISDHLVFSLASMITNPYVECNNCKCNKENHHSRLGQCSPVQHSLSPEETTLRSPFESRQFQDSHGNPACLPYP